jgi:hypothetical protein
MTTEPEADITPTATHSPSVAAAGSRIGLLAVFGSTFFELCGIFMLSPLLLLLLKQAQISTTVAGLFAATTWLGVFIITPFASQLDAPHRSAPGDVAGLCDTAAGHARLHADRCAVDLVCAATAGRCRRWPALGAGRGFIAEFAPPQHIGRTIGTYATLVGLTFVVGPVLLAG